MPATVSTHALEFAREQAAADLEAVIVAVGAAYREYERLTAALGTRVGADLALRLEVPIILHLNAAGFGAFLDRKLQDAPASLRELVAEQHERRLWA